MLHAVSIDRENNEDVNKLNKILNTYNELRNPQLRKERKDFAETTTKDMDQLFEGFGKFIERKKNG